MQRRQLIAQRSLSYRIKFFLLWLGLLGFTPPTSDHYQSRAFCLCVYPPIHPSTHSAFKRYLYRVSLGFTDWSVCNNCITFVLIYSNPCGCCLSLVIWALRSRTDKRFQRKRQRITMFITHKRLMKQDNNR